VRIGGDRTLGWVGTVFTVCFFYQPEPDGLFLAVEGYETDVSAKTGGQVANVGEGDMVKPGQLLVQIDDADLRAQLRGAAARCCAGTPERARLACSSCKPSYSKPI